MNNTPEKLNLEQANDFESSREAGSQRHHELQQQHERIDQASPEKTRQDGEKARVEALETAISVETESLGNETVAASPALRRGSIKKERDASYSRTMQQVQSELNAPSRAFSKVIHNKVVEKTSETLGATIARPNAILAGAVAAFIFTLALYIIAKHFGYRLSGFETIGAFILGWIVGQLFDFLRVMITGKRSS
ncbi:MAG: hypothetical protein ACHQTE_00195 [Candidatus Saccharimonadales bacterium]